MNTIKERIIDVVSKAGIALIKRKSPILKAVLDDPESVKLEAYIEGEEIIVKIKKKES